MMLSNLATLYLSRQTLDSRVKEFEIVITNERRKERHNAGEVVQRRFCRRTVQMNERRSTTMTVMCQFNNYISIECYEVKI